MLETTRTDCEAVSVWSVRKNCRMSIAATGATNTSQKFFGESATKQKSKERSKL